LLGDDPLVMDNPLLANGPLVVDDSWVDAALGDVAVGADANSAGFD